MKENKTNENLEPNAIVNPVEESNIPDKTPMIQDTILDSSKDSKKGLYISLVIIAVISIIGLIGWGVYSFEQSNQEQAAIEKANLWNDCTSDFDCFSSSFNASISYYRPNMVPGNFSCGLIVIYGYDLQQFPNCKNSEDIACYINFCGYMERFDLDTQNLISRNIISGAKIYSYGTLDVKEDMSSDITTNETNFKIAKCIVDRKNSDNETKLEEIEKSCTK